MEKQCEEYAIEEPEQVFSLINPGDNVHALLQVTQVCICWVDLMFGAINVAGILDTGAQRSLLSASSYERIQAQVPPLMEPPQYG